MDEELQRVISPTQAEIQNRQGMKKGECTAGLLILYYIKTLLKLTFGRNFGLICMDGLVGGGLTTGHPGSSLWILQSISWRFLAARYAGHVLRSLYSDRRTFSSPWEKRQNVYHQTRKTINLQYGSKLLSKLHDIYTVLYFISKFKDI